jgi:MFS family permease
MSPFLGNIRGVDFREDSPEGSRKFPWRFRRGKFFYGYVVALAAFFTWLTAWGTFTTFGVFFKSLVVEFGWTRAMTAGAISLSAVTRGSLGIVMGRLTDKFGPRGVVLVFGSFLGIGYLLMSRISSLWQFDIVYALIIGVGLSTVTIPIMATVARWFVKRRGLMIGIVQSGAGVGGMVLSPVAGWLILTYDWRFSYVVLRYHCLSFDHSVRAISQA